MFEAIDTVLGRSVAIKALNPSLDATVLMREASAVAAVSHPNIVAIYDLIQERGRLYLVLELVRGENLDEYLRTAGPLPLSSVMHILRDVSLAVAHAHRCGLVHGDVKPQNVLIATDGRIKLADFTLAHRWMSTAPHRVRGATNGFSAPEQWAGEGPTPRSDIYSLGRLLERMLLHTQSDSTRDVVRAAVLRATAAEPDERFASVDEFLAALPDPAAGDSTRVAALDRGSEATRILAVSPTRALGRPSMLPTALIATVVSIGGLSLAGHLTVFAGSPDVTVPQLVGSPMAAGLRVARSLTFRPRVAYRFSPSVPKGTIMVQSAASGTRLEPHALLRMVISAGPAPKILPDTLGHHQAEAVTRLAGLHFRVRVQTEESITRSPGDVVAQQPPPGTTSTPGTTVILTVTRKPWWWIF